MYVLKKVTKIDKVQNAPSQKEKIRVAAYCRVSTSNEAQLESLETQKSHYENYINSRSDWELAGIYFDEGITGTKKDKRPELLRLIKDCETNRIDFIITKSISRFSRSTTDCLELVRKLLNLNIPIYFEKENINTGSMESELFLTILSSMAEDESVSISENKKWSNRKQFRDGTFKAMCPPYGYCYNDGTMCIFPEQAEVVKRIFSDVLSGKGTTTIAKELNNDGIPSKQGKKWNQTTVKKILSNEAYIGDAIFQKTYTDEYFNRHINNGEKEMYYIQNHHEAIISKEDFKLASAIISQHATEKNISSNDNKYRNRYAFSGKIICSECGNTFKRRLHTNTYSKYCAWCCNTHLADKSKCSMLYLRDDDLKIAFATVLNKLIYGHNLILKPYVEALKSISGNKDFARIQHLEQLIKQNKEQQEVLTKLLCQGYIDQVLFTNETNSLLAQSGKYKKDIDTINSTINGDNSRHYEAEKLLYFTEHNTMINEYSENLFERFVDHIIVYSRHLVGFVMKCGLTFKEVI